MFGRRAADARRAAAGGHAALHAGARPIKDIKETSKRHRCPLHAGGPAAAKRDGDLPREIRQRSYRLLSVPRHSIQVTRSKRHARNATPEGMLDFAAAQLCEGMTLLRLSRWRRRLRPPSPLTACRRRRRLLLAQTIPKHARPNHLASPALATIKYILSWSMQVNADSPPARRPSPPRALTPSGPPVAGDPERALPPGPDPAVPLD